MGHVKACWQLALLYETGSGVPFSEAEAARYHKMACEKGWPPSQFLVACRMERDGVSMGEVAGLYRRAAEAGEALAANNLSAHLLHFRIDATDHGVANQQSPHQN